MMDLEFNNVTYTAVRRKMKFKMIPTLKTDRLEILHSVSGKFSSGQLSAIMGPSGAGKTCLLNALSCYRSEQVSGEVLVGGRPRDRRRFLGLSRYITQEDLLQPMLTVGELMRLAAALKLPPRCGDEDRESAVLGILKNLGLSGQMDTRTEDLSGGERKRLSIALELVNNPSIFFLDEPTSGLDQMSAIQCIRLLRMLAMQGRVVVCTIHQPSASMLEMFDQLYVVAQGSCIYRGTSDALIPFLSKVGLPCPKYYNPADHLIELTENASNVERLCEVMQNGKNLETVHSSSSNDLSVQLGEAITSNGGLGGDSDMWMKMSKENEESLSSGLLQFRLLLGRMITQILRNTQGIKIQLGHHLLCSTLAGICFYDIVNDATQLYNTVQLSLLAVAFFTYTQCMVPIITYPSQVRLAKREHFNRWYGLLPYYAAMTTSKLPMQITLNVAVCTIIYYLAGLPMEIYRLAMFCLVSNAVSLIAEGLGLAIGSLFNETNGNAVMSMFVGVFFGMTIYGLDHPRTVPWLMKTLMNTSFIRCGFVATVLVTLGLDRQPLDCPEIYCHLGQPRLMLEFLDFYRLSLWAHIAELFALLVIFRFLGYLALCYRFKR